MDVMLKHTGSPIRGELLLPPSKSISTRLVTLAFLSKGSVVAEMLSDCSDVVCLQEITRQLQKYAGASESVSLYAGDGAAVARFSLSLAAISPGNWILRGTDRLHQRPIGILVEALRKLGADINYIDKPGFLPLRIVGKELISTEISMPANESSQYFSSLAMLASVLPEGLEIILEGERVSLPYLDLSLELLRKCGINAWRKEHLIRVEQGTFAQISLKAEADWSAAAFAYQMVALAENSSLLLPSLHLNSAQGDVQLSKICQSFGVNTEAQKEGVRISGMSLADGPLLIDLSQQPDLLPSLSLAAAGRGIAAKFIGIKHLAIKESDRLSTIAKGLRELNIKCVRADDFLEVLPGIPSTNCATIDTQKDHRIAMAFAIMSIKTKSIIIRDADCVDKSWPEFWTTLRGFGFEIKQL